MGKYTGDQSGFSAFDDALLRNSSNEYLEVDSSPNGGFHIAYDPASNPYVQSRKLTAYWTAGAAGTRRAGVVLRAALGPAAVYEQGLTSGVDKTGYALVVETVSTTVWSTRIYRWSNGSYAIIASRLLNQSGDPFTPSFGSDIEITFSIENRNGSSHATGSVYLEPLFDGHKLTGWTISTDGAIENDDGTITDGSSGRVLAGPGQGFYSQVSGANEVRLQAFDQEAISYALDEREQLGIPVSQEQSGATQTLQIKHHWPVSRRTVAYDQEHETEIGYRHRHKSAQFQRREWTLKSRAATAEEVADLREDIRAAGGWDAPMNWVTPDQDSVVVRLNKDSFKVVKIDKDVYAFTLTLTEAVGPELIATYFEGRTALGEVDPSGWFNMHWEEDGTQIANPETGESASTVNPRPLTILFEEELEGPGLIYFETGGDAIADTNYTISETSPLSVAAGDTEATINITFLNRGRWYRERTLTITLTDVAGAVKLSTLPRLEYHVGIRPNPGEIPDVEFKAASSAKSAGVQSFGVPVYLNSNSPPVSDEDTTCYIRDESTGTVTYTIENGFIPSGVTSTEDTGGEDVVVNITNSGTGTITLHLDHPPDDGSEDNHWTFTDNFLHEGVDSSLDFEDQRVGEYQIPFAGEPGTYSRGGGTNAPGYEDYPGLYITQQSDIGVSPGDIKYQPSGEEMWVIRQSDYLKGWGQWYWRESFASAQYSGTTGRKLTFDTYCLMSGYVDELPTGVDGNTSYFVTINHRNRAPGDVEFGVIFQRGAASTDVDTDCTGNTSQLWSGGGSVATVNTPCGYWGLWSKKHLDSSARWGVEVETIDGADYTRLWVLTHYDGLSWYENNSAHTDSGTADSGSSSTQLVDTGRNFTTEGFGVGDVIENITDGCWGWITAVGTTTATHTTLKDGRDNDWGTGGGDSYRIWKNHRGTVSAGSTPTNIYDAAGGFTATFGTTSLYLKEIKNETTGELVTVAIGGVVDDNNISTETASLGWNTGDQYTVRWKSAAPTTSWEGNAIYRCAYASNSDSFNGEDASSVRYGGVANLRKAGVACWGPVYVAKSTTYSNPPPPYDGHPTPGTAAPGRYWERLGHWLEPRGNAYLQLAGNTSHTITVT